MRKTLFVFAAVAVLAGMAGAADFPIDLNSASLEEIMELPIEKAVAYAIYTGILTDTGSFRFANTNRDSFGI